MALKLMETAVMSVKNYLQANLNASIATVNAQHNDTTVLTQIPTGGFYISEQPQLAPDPFVMVIGDTSTMLRELNAEFRAKHTLDVLVVCRDPLKDTIRIRLYRYVQAMLECLFIDRRAQTIGQLFWEGPFADYGPVYTPRVGSGFFQDATISFAIQLDELPTYT